MFTVLWKTREGAEELFSSPRVVKVPALQQNAPPEHPCEGREYLSVEFLDGLSTSRIYIDSGEVFVMNGDGKTVATYRFQ